MAVDASGSSENPARYALLGNEVYIVENLKNLDRLPPVSFFVAFPLKIEGGSGSPVRAVALVPRRFPRGLHKRRIVVREARDGEVGP